MSPEVLKMTVKCNLVSFVYSEPCLLNSRRIITSTQWGLHNTVGHILLLLPYSFFSIPLPIFVLSYIVIHYREFEIQMSLQDFNIVIAIPPPVKWEEPGSRRHKALLET